MKLDLKHEHFLNGISRVITGAFSAAFWSASTHNEVTVTGMIVDESIYPDFTATFYPAVFGYTATASVGESTITVTVDPLDAVTIEISNPIPPTIPEWRCINELLSDGFSLKAQTYGSENIQRYIQNYAVQKGIPYYFYITADMKYDEEYDPDDVQVVTDYYEYLGYLYGSVVASNCNLVLLADAEFVEAVTFAQSLNNFKGILIQSVYDTRTHQSPDKTSRYNSTFMYLDPQIGNTYRAMMQDREAQYDVTVTITSDTTATIGGNKRCLIYGIT